MFNGNIVNVQNNEYFRQKILMPFMKIYHHTECKTCSVESKL